MSQYKVGLGYDLASVDLSPLVPQCTSAGVQYARRSFAASGDVVQEGAYVELKFSALGSAAMYQALLTQFDILGSSSAPVTVWVRSEIFGYTLYNGIAIQPQIATNIAWSVRPKDVVILVRNLVQLIEGA